MSYWTGSGRHLAVVLRILSLLGLLVAACGEPPPERASDGRDVRPPTHTVSRNAGQSSISLEDLQTLRQAFGQQRYAVEASGRSGKTEFEAGNPAQRLGLRFDGSGVEVTPWQAEAWRLRLASYGRGGLQREVGSADLVAYEN